MLLLKYHRPSPHCVMGEKGYTIDTRQAITIEYK